MKVACMMNSIDGASLMSCGTKLKFRNGALVSRRCLRLATFSAGPMYAFGTASNSSSSGGGGFVHRGINGNRKASLNVVCLSPRPIRYGGRSNTRSPSWSRGGISAGAAAPSSSERPLFPHIDIPSDPSISFAISTANTWQDLRDLYTVAARRIDPGQLLALTQRLAHVTGAVVWPEGVPLPEPTAAGGAPWAAPILIEQEAEEVVALAQTLCRATQVCLPEMYGMQQVAGLLQALVSLGVMPPPSWLKSAELVALRTQREGDMEGGRRATSELLNELLAMAASFQRVGHVPDPSFVGLLGAVQPLEEVQTDQADAPVLLVLAAPQLLCLARAVLLWGLQPPPEWPELFLQATYIRISRANKL
ncbi:hypothetical protein VaNZ11_013799, partial [Volvox africanus]